MSVNRKMDKPIVVYPYNVIHISNEKALLIHATTWVGLKIIKLTERRQKEYILYDSTYIKS